MLLQRSHIMMILSNIKYEKTTKSQDAEQILHPLVSVSIIHIFHKAMAKKVNKRAFFASVIECRNVYGLTQVTGIVAT